MTRIITRGDVVESGTLRTPGEIGTRRRRGVRAAVIAVAILAGGIPVLGGPPNCPDAGTVLAQQKISNTAGGFTGTLRLFEMFGGAVANIGDLDGDGIADLAVGAAGDNDGGAFRGAVWILFLNADATVKGQQKISSTAGGFTGPIGDFDDFGSGVASIGDLDGDGVPDLAVGARQGDDGGSSRGEVWILFLNTDGTVRSEQKISGTTGGFTGQLSDGDLFGVDIASLGDLDGDGIPELAVGAIGDNDGGAFRGAIWILFLNADGTVKGQQKISSTVGGFTGQLDDDDGFGGSLDSLGDLDGDGVADLAVGASGDDDGGSARGAVWILFLNTDGTVKGHQKVSNTAGGFAGQFCNGEAFGISAGSLGDLDGDGVTDLAAGTLGDDDGGRERGSIWILFLNTDGTVRGEQKISSIAGGFTGQLDDFDHFGLGIASLGDPDGDGIINLAVGAIGDDDGERDAGAVWILSLGGCTGPQITRQPAPAILVDVGAGSQTLSVEAHGPAPLSFQWRRDGMPLSDGGTISGSTTDTLIVVPTLANEARYDVVVSDGARSVTSDPSVLAVRNTCPADLNGDGTIDVIDFFQFVSLFAAGCP